jgi:hypothetical protein
VSDDARPTPPRRTPLSAALVALVALALVPSGCTSSGKHPPPAPPAAALATEARVVDRPELDARRWLLQRDAALAIAEGAGTLGVLAADVAAEGDRVGAFVELPQGGCLLAFARGSDGVDDVDMLAFSDEGTPIGADEASDPHPALLLCPPLPSRAYIVARVAAGRGLVALGAQPVPFEAAARVARALNAKGRPADGSRENEVWPGLEAKAEGLRRDAGGRWEELRRVAVPIDARAPARVTATLDAGRCMSALIAPSDDTSEIDVQVSDGEGRIIGRGTEVGRDRVAIICSALGTQLTFELRPRVAAGVVAVVLARTIAGTEAEISARFDRVDAFPRLELPAARARLGERLKAAGYSAPTAQATGGALAGRRASIGLVLPRGCSRLDVIGGLPTAGLVADAWSPDGALLGRGEGGAGVALFACGDGGKARVDVEATGRPGPFAIEVRPEAAAAPQLVSAGLAGARLLARLNANGEPLGAGALTLLRPLPLDAATMRSVDLRVPERRCLEVLAAVGSQGSGVDLRLLDGPGGDEISLSRAASSTMTRVCAGTTPRAVVAELRLAAGRADVLLGARLVEPAR